MRSTHNRHRIILIALIVAVALTAIAVIARTRIFFSTKQDIATNVQSISASTESSVYSAIIVEDAKSTSDTSSADDTDVSSADGSDDYQNIDSAHDFVNFEYLIQEIGDATEIDEETE